jgi:hypothetical protein
MPAQPDHRIPHRPPPRQFPVPTEDLDLASLELAWCPSCDQPTEILSRYVLGSTDGPIEHVRIRCLVGHKFLMPTSLLRDLSQP